MRTLTLLLALAFLPATASAITTTIEIYQGGSDFAVGRFVYLGSTLTGAETPSCSCPFYSIGYRWEAFYWGADPCDPDTLITSQTLAWACVDIPDPGRYFKITANPSPGCWTVEECDP